jgi:hypothetical protein
MEADGGAGSGGGGSEPITPRSTKIVIKKTDMATKEAFPPEEVLQGYMRRNRGVKRY